MGMESEYNIYHIFNKEGKIRQVELSLLALSDQKPITSVIFDNKILVAQKRTVRESLEEPENDFIFKLSNDCYLTITGLAGDKEKILSSIQTLYSNLSAKYGFDISADIICRAFADKQQEIIQTSGERISCFGAIFFGYEFGTAKIYYTYSSAISYAYKACSVGQNSSQMNKYLEENYNSSRNGHLLTIGAISKSLGADFLPRDIEFYILENGKEPYSVSESEVDKLLIQSQEDE